PSDQGDLSDDFIVDAMSSSGTVALHRYPSEAFLWTNGSMADLSGEAAAYSWRAMGVLAGGRLSSDVVGPNGDGDAAVTLWVPISEGDSGTLALRRSEER